MLNVYKYKEIHPLVLEGALVFWFGSVGWKDDTHGKGWGYYSARKI